ncbi:Bug family tripartite tricarboxylate transporter substrate binding protein [Ottowia thiooxydans]|uniref:Bug family tripartite tricarboxylate transporter substrate binding protein n=1 Tax=Ottowia thiooxydans TaxID=219182 RepID=UPI00040DB4A5|nr:tripartite tricarboxylate transporter substrate binding protein [Ottowia thiooxydans]
MTSDYSRLTRRQMLSISAGLGGALLASAEPALAQDTYPSRPIRLIVPFAPGGGTDVVARVVAQEMAAVLGTSVIVDNKAGANGIVGTLQGLRSAPDGYTLIFTIEATMAMNPSLYKAATYKPADFDAISLVSRQPYVLVVHPSMEAQTLKSFVEYAKKSPGKLNYASGAAAAFLAGELFKTTVGIDIPNIPYKGSGEAITDVLSGRVPVMVSSPVAVLPHIRAGKLRPLAVTSPDRYPLLPQVPTVAEQGFNNFDVTGWYGIAAPRGTPPDIVSRLNTAINKGLQSKSLLTRFEGVGVEPAGSRSSNEFAELMRSETDRWSGVIRQTNLQKE